MLDYIIDYFTNIPKAHRSLILFGGLALFLLIENAAPFFTRKYNLLKHTGLNIFFTLTTVVVNLAMAFILYASCEWVVEADFGLLQWTNANNWVVLIVGLMSMDLIGAWLAHFVEHKIWFLWQFHAVHHTDKHVDASTANRHHPGESVIRFVFTTAAVFIVGAPLWLVFLYQSLSVVLSQFNHANLNIPNWLDAALRWVICTPNMHRIHHHYRQPYSDMNYGNIFSFWDRIFGTYVIVDNKKLVYGLDTHMSDPEANNILTLLKIPFNKYRPHIEYEEEEKL